MKAQRPRPALERATLVAIRYALWPFARLRPRSGWARIYHRVDELLYGGVPGPVKRSLLRPPSPLATFIVLVSVAAVLWLYDLFRRPEPAPGQGGHTGYLAPDSAGPRRQSALP